MHIAGDGLVSDAVSVTPAATGAADAPSVLTAHRGYGSAEISFTAGSNGGSAITNYKYSTNNGSTWTAFSPAVTSSPVTIGGLTNGTTYNLKLRAVNTAGDGAISDAVSVTPASVDAISWTAQTGAEANQWKSVTYGNGLFVAVSDSGTHRVMTSPDGVTWTARYSAEASAWNSVTYGNGLFVAVAYYGSHRVMTSPDGVTWTSRDAAERNDWNSVTYGDGLFVAVASSGTHRVMTSVDGVTWTSRDAAERNSWLFVTSGNGLFVAVAADGTHRVMTSADGLAWTARTAAEASVWVSVTFGNGLFVAVAANGTYQVMTSPDGVTWTLQTGAEANQWTSVTYGNGVFVAVSYEADSHWVMTSVDGVTWTARDAAAGYARWNAVTYANGLFVAVADIGIHSVMTSSLEPWVAAPAAPTSLNATPGDGSVSISFTAGADGGASITNYKYSTDDGSTWMEFDPSVTSSPVSISGLTNGTTYKVKLRAVNTSGDGAASSAVSVTPRTTPAAPTSLVVTPGDSSVSVAFTAGATGGAAISKYEFSTDGGTTWADAVGTTSPVTVNGLTNYTAYTIKLRAVNIAGNSDPSDASASVTPAQSGPTLCPSTALSKFKIQACWNAFTPTRGTVMRYQANVFVTGTRTKVRFRRCITRSIATSCVNLRKLEPATIYDVRVKVLIRIAPNQLFWTFYSDAVQVTTLP